MRKKSEKEAVPKKKRKWWQRALIILAWVVGVLVMLVVLLFAWLTITEYKPKKVESVEVTGELRAGSEFEKGVKANPDTFEETISDAIQDILTRQAGSVTCIPTDEQWFGMTYIEELDMVKDRLKTLREEGVYVDSKW